MTPLTTRGSIRCMTTKGNRWDSTNGTDGGWTVPSTLVTPEVRWLVKPSAEGLSSGLGGVCGWRLLRVHLESAVVVEREKFAEGDDLPGDLSKVLTLTGERRWIKG